MIVIIRVSLSIGLLIMVYRETGPWTTVAIALLGLASEVAALMLRKEKP